MFYVLKINIASADDPAPLSDRASEDTILINGECKNYKINTKGYFLFLRTI